MSMHLRNSRDMLDGRDEGWWKSRTGLEQKLIIVSTLLFVLSFCLIITVAVIDNRNKKSGHSPPVTPETTITAIVTTEGDKWTFTEIIVDNTTNADNSSSAEPTIVTNDVESQTSVTDEGTGPTERSSDRGTTTVIAVETTTVANDTVGSLNGTSTTNDDGKDKEKVDGDDNDGKDKEKEKVDAEDNDGKDKEKEKVDGEDNDGKNKEKEKVDGEDNDGKDKEKEKVDGEDEGKENANTANDENGNGAGAESMK